MQSLDAWPACLDQGLSDLANSKTCSIQALSSRFHYNAGFASREEDPAAPGVMAAADDPPEVFVQKITKKSYQNHFPEVTIEPHLEMSYNLAMPAKIIFYCHQVF